MTIHCNLYGRKTWEYNKNMFMGYCVELVKDLVYYKLKETGGKESIHVHKCVFMRVIDSKNALPDDWECQREESGHLSIEFSYLQDDIFDRTQDEAFLGAAMKHTCWYVNMPSSMRGAPGHRGRISGGGGQSGL